MGAGNVKAVFALWGDLPGAAFRLLTYMALRSKDADSPPTYYGGRDDLAFALGRKIPSAADADAEGRREREAAFKAVKAAIGVLVKQGAIAPAERARPGWNAVYALKLDRQGTENVPHSPANEGGTLGNHRRWHEGRGVVKLGCPHCSAEAAPAGDMGDGFRPPVGDGFRPQWGTVFRDSGDGNRPPEEKKDQSGLSEGIDGWSSRQPAGVARTREAAKIECESCGAVLDPDGSCFVCRTAGRAG